MRAYDITITKPDGSNFLNGQRIRRFSSLVANNVNDPAALNIILDFYIYTYDAPTQQCMLQIHGVSIADIEQFADFSGCDVEIKGGFQKGLPLNNPQQFGPILKGTILQSYANWVGTEQTLDFVITAPAAVRLKPTNISFDWRAGTPLSQALAATLTAAFPGVKQTIQISDKLVLNHDQPGQYTSLPPFAEDLRALTQVIIGGSYRGVFIAWTSDGFLVQDGTVKPAPVQLAFQELIGQPVWFEQNTIYFACPMRCDLSVGSIVTMPKPISGNAANPYGPPGAVITTRAVQTQARQGSIFKGEFLVTNVHHIGEFRNPSGMSWATVYNAVPQ